MVASELSAPRATGKVMAALPGCGIGLGYLLGGDPIHWLLGGPLGWGCLLAGVVLACLGVLWIEALARQRGALGGRTWRTADRLFGGLGPMGLAVRGFTALAGVRAGGSRAASARATRRIHRSGSGCGWSALVRGRPDAPRLGPSAVARVIAAAAAQSAGRRGLAVGPAVVELARAWPGRDPLLRHCAGPAGAVSAPGADENGC